MNEPFPALPPRVCFVAAPLMARTGVYRSVHELVAEARSRGLEWSGVLGIRPGAPGGVVTPGVSEATVLRHGPAVLDEVRDLVLDSPAVAASDVVVTLVTQSDVALARLRRSRRAPVDTWHAWVRGLPWPAPGEQAAWRRAVLRRLESGALRAADEVWATTPVLADEIARVRRPELVRAGVKLGARTVTGDRFDELVWAGRFDVEKRPHAFVDLVEACGVRGRLHGVGPLEQGLRSRAGAGAGVRVMGWTDPHELHRTGDVFVGTAYREAFGRSAAEAAASGLPLVLGDRYGAAPTLITDDELRRRFVLPVDEPAAWVRAVRDLAADDGLRRAHSDHVAAAARAASIAASVDAVLERVGGGAGPAATSSVRSGA